MVKLEGCLKVLYRIGTMDKIHNCLMFSMKAFLVLPILYNTFKFTHFVDLGYKACYIAVSFNAVLVQNDKVRVRCKHKHKYRSTERLA